jgi:hypothetical protein
MVCSPLSLLTGRFQARTSFHKWGRKQGLASAPESTAEDIARLPRHTERHTATGHNGPMPIGYALETPPGYLGSSLFLGCDAICSLRRDEI